MTQFNAVPESTTEEVTDETDAGSTEIGTTESETTGMYTTEGMIHLREFELFIMFSQPRLILMAVTVLMA